MKVTPHYLKRVVFIDHPTESRIWPATENFLPGKTVYTERLYTYKGKEYRTWDPYKSKFAACLFNKIKDIPPLEDKRILYLGAATGTTVSHLSDIVAEDGGIIYALEFSPRVARRLIQLSQIRPNIVPIVADARNPSEYVSLVWTVDFLFQDISQIDQANIFLSNVDAFLKAGGRALFIIKAASIDSTRPFEEVAAEQISKIEEHGLKILCELDISTFEREHWAVLVEKPAS